MSPTKNARTREDVRTVFMRHEHMPGVLAMERENFEFPWSESDFMRCLRERNNIGIVALRGGRMVGFMVYSFHRRSLDLLNFCVAASHRRQGIGSAMVFDLKRKLCSMDSSQRRFLRLLVRERNLPAQVFFRHHGFRAVATIRGHYEDTDEDAYRFLWQRRAEP